MIEDSVPRSASNGVARQRDTREQLNVAEVLWQSFEEDHSKLVGALLKEVTYDGTTGAVSLNLTRSEDTHED